MAQFLQRGFSLLEFSIVLMIIGLVMGGVLAGQHMIRAAGLQAILSDSDRYIKAMQTFQDKYIALPGDFNGAEALWGSDAACPDTPFNTTKKKVTCNGNADGKLGGASADGYERFRAWQHLANAQLIEGSYTGARGLGGAQHAMPGMNVPVAPLGGGFAVSFRMQSTGDSEYYPERAGLKLFYGKQSSNEHPFGAILNPTEMLGIDRKMDDGMPGTGRMRTYKPTGSYLPNCVNAAGDYNTHSPGFPGAACAFVLDVVF